MSTVKLTIRQRVKTDSFVEIARDYSVHLSLIYLIRNNKIWKDIT